MQRYTIKDIRSELEQKRGEPYTDDELAILITAFVTHVIRRGLYDKSAVYKAIKRGWFSSQMAYFFKQYAAQ